MKCLMKEWTASSDTSATIKSLKDAIGESYSVVGSGSEIHSSKEWLTLKIKQGW